MIVLKLNLLLFLSLGLLIDILSSRAKIILLWSKIKQKNRWIYRCFRYYLKIFLDKDKALFIAVARKSQFQFCTYSVFYFAEYFLIIWIYTNDFPIVFNIFVLHFVYNCIDSRWKLDRKFKKILILSQLELIEISKLEKLLFLLNQLKKTFSIQRNKQNMYQLAM